MYERSCGILMHISSLPGKYAIGDLGPRACEFASALAGAGVSFWQWLPLSPTSIFIGNSPYSSPSAFAGNPLFISPDLLVRDGYISDADIQAAENSTTGFAVVFMQPLPAASHPGRVNYDDAHSFKTALLERAFLSARDSLEGDLEFRKFCTAHSYWLDDFALFTAIKGRQLGLSWEQWPENLKKHEQTALRNWEEEFSNDVLRQKFIQFLFYSQLNELREHCRSVGVKIIGDLPIYVTHDSADVWSHQHLFNLDSNGQPLTVAGVPPDYYSATGQLWGNPVYRWDRMREDGFSWWKMRIRHSLLQFDLIRLDHFRGFSAYWEVKAGEPTAVNGHWSPAAGDDLFAALLQEFGSLPVFAEDLGIITEDVSALIEKFKLAGMKVLHFAFSGPDPARNDYIPFRHPENSVVYAGTHDNSTSKEWFMTASEEERRNFMDYTGREITAESASEAMMRLALSSRARLAVLTMQDVLGLGPEGKMNTPSVAKGNWEWRFPDELCSQSGAGYPREQDLRLVEAMRAVFNHVAKLCRIYGRTPS